MISKLYFTITFLSLFFFVYTKTNAQPPDWSWAKGIGGTDFDQVNSMVVDPGGSGDVYTTGFFEGTIDLDPGLGTFNLMSEGETDIFISKLDGSGNLVWAKAMGGISYDSGESIALDASGNVYITGNFNESMDFDPGEGVFNLTETGGFISKFDPLGNFVWAKTIGGNGNNIALDIFGGGDIYITGHFLETNDFDPGPGIYNLSSAGLYDIFILKLDGAGNFIWAKAMGGMYYDYVSSIAVDPKGSGNIYTTGEFRGTIDFNPDSLGIFNLNSNGEYDIFILKLNSSGNFEWAKGIGGTEDDYGSSLIVDPAGSGDIFTTGGFEGTVDFNPDSLAILNLTALGFADVFISRLDSLGNFVWTKAMGKKDGSVSSVCIAVEPSGSGGIYTTGEFGARVDFDPGPGIFNLSATSDGFDCFISKLDGSGNFVWAKAMGGLYYDEGRSIIVDALDQVHVAGTFESSSLSFGSITLTNTDNLNNSSDLFIAKLNASTTSLLKAEVKSQAFNIYPNPTTDQLIITSIQDNVINYEITINNIIGEIALSTSGHNNENEIIFDMSALAPGIYFIALDLDGNRVIRKIVKE